MRRMRLEILNSGKIRAVSYTSYRKSMKNSNINAMKYQHASNTGY